MKIFQDMFTNDKVMSDAHPFTLEYKGAIMKVKSKYRPRPGEEAETSGLHNDLLMHYNLVNIPLEKAEYTHYTRRFAKQIKNLLEANFSKSRADMFQQGFTEFSQFIESRFTEFTFYTGKSERLEGALIYSYWEDENDEGETFYFIKDALKEMSV